MTIVGFNFTSLRAERKAMLKGKINIENNVKIDNITDSELNVGDKKMKTLSVEFSYSSTYTPDIGEVAIKGILIYMTDAKKTEEVLKSWKGKEKKVPEDIMAPIINTILNNCTIMALEMTKEVNLPPQIQLPKVEVSNK